MEGLVQDETRKRDDKIIGKYENFYDCKFAVGERDPYGIEKTK